MIATQPSLLRRYGAALLMVALAAATRASLDSIVGDRIPFATFLIAIVFAALFAGLGPALLCTAISGFLGNYLFIQPRYEFSADPVALAWMTLFAGGGILSSVVGSHLRTTRLRLRAAARAEALQAQAVQAERKRLGDLIASIPGVVWEAWGEPDSKKQRIDYVSDYVTEMVGYDVGEWTSRPNFWLEIVHPDDRERAAHVASLTFQNSGPGENEFRWITKDGRAIWALARSTTIKDEQGRPIGMRGVTFDITARKQAEQRLSFLAEISTAGPTLPFAELAGQIARRAAEVVGEYCIIRRLRDGHLEAVAYAHANPEAEPMIREVASHSNILELNKTYAEILREPRTIVDNDVHEEAFAHVDRSGVEELFARYRARQAVWTPLFSQGVMVGTLTVGRSTGPPFTAADVQFVEAIAARAALAFENARLVEAAQREAEEARQARAEAEEAGRIKDEFLATLSHELRTPLNAILGWAHMLRDPSLPAERRQTAIETILRNAQSQEQLISDILDVQRIMAGKIRLNLHTVDLGNIVRAAAETVQPTADAKQVRLQLLLDLDTPPVWGDPDRLQQIVWNLLSNGIKFAPQGGQVQVRLLKRDDDCELTVEDNGPGILPTFMPHLFERFRQADSSTTRTHKGLGLGLAIVRSLVEMHGGTITAANNTAPGHSGAVFTVRLPRERSASTEVVRREAAVDRGAALSAAIPSLDGVRVLVVEDDHDARELLGAILQRCGADVMLTSSAADAMATFSRKRPDVIVSDIEMPREDGYTLIRRIRARPSDEGGDVPAAALTAYASAADRMKALAAGFNIHMAKPVQPAELATVVASLAARRTA